MSKWCWILREFDDGNIFTTETTTQRPTSAAIGKNAAKRHSVETQFEQGTKKMNEQEIKVIANFLSCYDLWGEFYEFCLCFVDIELEKAVCEKLRQFK